MAGRIRDLIARNLRKPEGFIGNLLCKFRFENNHFLEQNAARLCKIQPHHKVLEVGFGPGIGLKAAYNYVKDGTGVIYGVEHSELMLKKASQKLKSEIKKKKVDLVYGSVDQLPFNTDTFHSVFHSNCYYFWSDRKAAIQELYRVMKPGSIMVATLQLDFNRRMGAKGFFKYAKPDPVRFMWELENGGFEDVRIDYLSEGAVKYEAIIACITEKQAYDDEFEEEIAKDMNSKIDSKHYSDFQS